jgi:hypothetical protein
MTLDAIGDDELASGIEAAGKVAVNSAPTANAALKASEAKCFKMVTPIFSRVPFTM